MEKKSKYNLKFFLLAYTLTMSGTQIFDFFIKWYLPSITGSGILLGYTLGISTLVSTLLSLLFGVLSDLKNKKKILIFSDLTSSTVCLLGFFGYRVGFHEYSVAIVAIILALIKMLYAISSRSVFKTIFSKEFIPNANRIQSVFKQIIKLLMPVVANILVVLISPEFFFILNSISFLASALVNAFLKPFNSLKSTNRGENIGKLSLSLIKDELKQGFSEIILNKKVFSAILLVSLANIFSGGYETILPVYLSGTNRTMSYGLALSMMAIGALLAPVSTWTNGKRKGFSLLWGPIVLGAVAIILSGFTNWGILIGAFLYGFGTSVFDINFSTELQINVSEEQIGKVFSVVFFLSGLLTPIGQIIFPYIFNSVNINIFVLIGGIMLAVTLILFTSLKIRKHN